MGEVGTAALPRPTTATSLAVITVRAAGNELLVIQIFVDLDHEGEETAVLHFEVVVEGEENLVHLLDELQVEIFVAQD